MSEPCRKRQGEGYGACDAEVEEACRGRRIVTSSDAHYLWDIAEGDPARRSPDSRPCLFEPDGDPLSRLVLSALPR